MSKIGRNDPCPCGSGKKYKKCCLPKEQQKSVASRRKDETDDLFEEMPAELTHRRRRNQDGIMEASATTEVKLEDEPFVSPTISDELPEISEEEETIVDAWWAAYDDMEDPDKIIRHLDSFFQTHPGLVTNLELHHEALFELGDKLIDADRASEYIELLQRLRRDFPDVYLRRFSYFDLEVIRYKIASQEREGIEDYLNWFKQYPDHDADNLFSLIDFLMATECDQPLFGLLEAAYYPVCRSKKVIGGSKILAPLIFSYCAPYLHQGWTRADLEVLAEQLKSIRIPLNDQFYHPENLDSLFEEILGERDAEFFATFSDTRDIHEYYRTVTHNFMGWLHKEKQFSWMKALFYRNLVNRYLIYVIPDGKRPKRPFVFSKKLLDSTISRIAGMMFSLDTCRTLGALNAIHWFAEYLLRYQAISKDECANVQEWCEALWGSAFPQFLESTIDALAFDNFPQ